MQFTGRLITGDFGDNTMTFEIEGEMILQSGRYKIVQIEGGNAVKNNGDLAEVVGQSEQLVCECGNKLTDKEMYFGQCLQCDKSVEEAN